MLDKIQAIIKDYEKQVDGSFTDKIFKSKTEELKWVESLLKKNEIKGA